MGRCLWRLSKDQVSSFLQFPFGCGARRSERLKTLARLVHPNPVRALVSSSPVCWLAWMNLTSPSDNEVWYGHHVPWKSSTKSSSLGGYRSSLYTLHSMRVKNIEILNPLTLGWVEATTRRDKEYIFAIIIWWYVDWTRILNPAMTWPP